MLPSSSSLLSSPSSSSSSLPSAFFLLPLLLGMLSLWVSCASSAASSLASAASKAWAAPLRFSATPCSAACTAASADRQASHSATSEALLPSARILPWPSYTMRPLGCTLEILPAVRMLGAWDGAHRRKRFWPRISTYRLSWKSWCSPLDAPSFAQPIQRLTCCGTRPPINEGQGVKSCVRRHNGSPHSSGWPSRLDTLTCCVVRYKVSSPSRMRWSRSLKAMGTFLP
mmetsp:Transcript_2555/g.6505  ORF Transcript_2555/g.6505 Transcript_2555/m.6505 type:complete len:228 (+) Transcript_2555:282-965(+)